jgi:hypothetical protein
MNRYYSAELARFVSPDPYQASGGAGETQSWNRYTYVAGDTINFLDPHGLAACPAGSENTCVDVSEANDDVAYVGVTQQGPTQSQAYYTALRAQRAFVNMQTAINLLSARLLSTNCMKLLSPLGVTADDIRATAIGERAIDGTSLNAKLSTVSVQSPDFPDETLAQFFQNHPGVELLASGPRPNSSQTVIYYDPAALWQTGPILSFADVLHETLHNMGFYDNDPFGGAGLGANGKPTLATVFGPAGANTSSYSQKLQQCYPQ